MIGDPVPLVKSRPTTKPDGATHKVLTTASKGVGFAKEPD